jgi:hypothetical protein
LSVPIQHLPIPSNNYTIEDENETSRKHSPKGTTPPRIGAFYNNVLNFLGLTVTSNNYPYGPKKKNKL